MPFPPFSTLGLPAYRRPAAGNRSEVFAATSSPSADAATAPAADPTPAAPAHGSCSDHVSRFLAAARHPSHRAHPLLASLSAASAAAAPPGSPPPADGDPGVHIVCRPCSDVGPEGLARAYVEGPHPLAVVLCDNRLGTSDEVAEVLVHEFVHVYDVAVRGFDLGDCRDLARSEVRAAREAECHVPGAPGGAGGVSILAGSPWWTRRCIRSSATQAAANMFPDRGGGCVRAVFEEAVEDRMPWTDGVHGAGVGAAPSER